MSKSHFDQNTSNAGKGPGSSSNPRMPQNNDPQDPNGEAPSPNNRKWLFTLGYFMLALLILYAFNSMSQKKQVIEFSEFKQKVASGEIKRVQLGRDYYVGVTYSRKDFQNQEGSSYSDLNQAQGQTVYRAIPVEDRSFVELMDKQGVEYYARATTAGDFLSNLIFAWILPFGVIMLLWWFLFTKFRGGMGIMSVGKNKAQLMMEGDTGVTFDDVAGAEESKEELVEVVDFLQKPEKYEAVGGKIPKGVLLVGPPGTGKTLLAKAVAGEAGVPFFKISGSDFVELFVGVGASRVRDLFKQAREKAPCIVFIDELDAIGKSRANGLGNNDEREQTLNQLLVEMDGFDGWTGVIILAATNRPEVLDPALMRPGRFDRQVLVDRPDLKGREQILKVHAKNVKLGDQVDLNKVAKSTAGFAGADLANLVNEAALLAVRAGRGHVAQEDFGEALEKLIAGLQKKSRVINPKEKEVVAYHETGHALVAAFTDGADPVQKISIVPRGMGALGYTMQLPTEDRFLVTEQELLGKIDVLLGGRAAEQLIFGEISNGASNDISRATEIARKMIAEYGMSEKFRNMALGTQRTSYLGGESGFGVREYSEETQRYIDEQISANINTRYAHVLEFLKNNLTLLHDVSRRLLKVEVMEAEEFEKMVAQHKELAEAPQQN